MNSKISFDFPKGASPAPRASRIHKIVIATDSFKGSCSAIQVTQYLEEGLLSYRPDLEIVKIPVADGGEGTVDALLFAAGGERITVPVTGPLGETVNADFGILPDGTAVLEMAQASGLPLIPREARDPLRATTFGTGQLMKAALDRGCQRMILGIGGSATNDGGAGMAQALGAILTDENGNPLAPGGGALDRLAHIDVSGLDRRISECEIIVACDVTNPLCGPTGASAVYGPQKGANGQMVQRLDLALENYADRLRKDLDADVADLPGAGAAGGLGAGLMAFCGAKICSGIDSVLDIVGFESLLQGADMVITGEGAIDHQTLFGKVPAGVTSRAKAALPGVAVIAVAGTLGRDYESAHSCGIDLMLSIANGPISLADCIADAPRLLQETGRRIGHLTDLLL